MPKYDIQGQNFLAQTGAEFTGFHLAIKRGEEDAWIRFANETYEEWVEEGHILKYGSLDRLAQEGYKPFISKAGPDGLIVSTTSPRG